MSKAVEKVFDFVWQLVNANLSDSEIVSLLKEFCVMYSAIKPQEEKEDGNDE